MPKKKERKMNQQVLQEIEYSLLESRLGFLRDKGVRSDTHHLSDAFLNLMEDPWTLCSALADVYAVSEMKDPKRDLAVSEALNEDDDDMMEFMFGDDDLFEETE
jgi:hypothetical protein